MKPKHVLMAEVGEVEAGGAPEEIIVEQVEEAKTPQDAALDDLGLNDTSEIEDAEIVDDEAKPDGEPAKEPEADKEAKAPEAVTDADLEPLQTGDRSTRDRFKKITDGYREEKTRAETLAEENGRYKESFDAMRSLGFTDEAAANDLVNLSTYREVLSSGDVEKFNSIISEQIQQFEAMHGKKVAIKTSILDNFEDLRQRVDDLDLDEETALELARNRTIKARSDREASRVQEVQAKTQASQADIDASVASIASMQAGWQKSDPDYSAVIKHLQPLMPEIARAYPPAMWAQTVQINYNTIKKTLMAAAASAPSPQPMRGNGRVSGTPAPSNPQEAALLDMGFDSES